MHVLIAMHAYMVEAVGDWHPALRGLVERVDLSTLFARRTLSGWSRRRHGRVAT